MGNAGSIDQNSGTNDVNNTAVNGNSVNSSNTSGTTAINTGTQSPMSESNTNSPFTRTNFFCHGCGHRSSIQNQQEADQYTTCSQCGATGDLLVRSEPINMNSILGPILSQMLRGGGPGESASGTGPIPRILNLQPMQPQLPTISELSILQLNETQVQQYQQQQGAGAVTTSSQQLFPLPQPQMRETFGPAPLPTSTSNQPNTGAGSSSAPQNQPIQFRTLDVEVIIRPDGTQSMRILGPDGPNSNMTGVTAQDGQQVQNLSGSDQDIASIIQRDMERNVAIMEQNQQINTSDNTSATATTAAATVPTAISQSDQNTVTSDNPRRPIQILPLGFHYLNNPLINPLGNLIPDNLSNLNLNQNLNLPGMVPQAQPQNESDTVTSVTDSTTQSSTAQQQQTQQPSDGHQPVTTVTSDHQISDLAQSIDGVSETLQNALDRFLAGERALQLARQELNGDYSNDNSVTASMQSESESNDFNLLQDAMAEGYGAGNSSSEEGGGGGGSSSEIRQQRVESNSDSVTSSEESSQSATEINSNSFGTNGNTAASNSQTRHLLSEQQENVLRTATSLEQTASAAREALRSARQATQVLAMTRQLEMMLAMTRNRSQQMQQNRTAGVQQNVSTGLDQNQASTSNTNQSDTTAAVTTTDDQQLSVDNSANQPESTQSATGQSNDSNQSQPGTVTEQQPQPQQPQQSRSTRLLGSIDRIQQSLNTLSTMVDTLTRETTDRRKKAKERRMEQVWEKLQKEGRLRKAYQQEIQDSRKEAQGNSIEQTHCNSSFGAAADTAGESGEGNKVEKTEPETDTQSKINTNETVNQKLVADSDILTESETPELDPTQLSLPDNTNVDSPNTSKLIQSIHENKAPTPVDQKVTSGKLKLGESFMEKAANFNVNDSNTDCCICLCSCIAETSVPSKESKTQESDSDELVCKEVPSPPSDSESPPPHLELDPSELSLRLPCSHVFHDECLKPWFLTKKNCPICRTELVDVSDLETPRNGTFREITLQNQQNAQQGQTNQNQAQTNNGNTESGSDSTQPNAVSGQNQNQTTAGTTESLPTGPAQTVPNMMFGPNMIINMMPQNLNSINGGPFNMNNITVIPLDIRAFRRGDTATNTNLSNLSSIAEGRNETQTVERSNTQESTTVTGPVTASATPATVPETATSNTDSRNNLNPTSSGWLPSLSPIAGMLMETLLGMPNNPNQQSQTRQTQQQSQNQSQIQNFNTVSGLTAGIFNGPSTDSNNDESSTSGTGRRSSQPTVRLTPTRHGLNSVTPNRNRNSLSPSKKSLPDDDTSCDIFAKGMRRSLSQSSIQGINQQNQQQEGGSSSSSSSSGPSGGAGDSNVAGKDTVISKKNTKNGKKSAPIVSDDKNISSPDGKNAVAAEMRQQSKSLIENAVTKAFSNCKIDSDAVIDVKSDNSVQKSKKLLSETAESELTLPLGSEMTAETISVKDSVILNQLDAKATQTALPLVSKDPDSNKSESDTNLKLDEQLSNDTSNITVAKIHQTIKTQSTQPEFIQVKPNLDYSPGGDIDDIDYLQSPEFEDPDINVNIFSFNEKAATSSSTPAIEEKEESKFPLDTNVNIKSESDQTLKSKSSPSTQNLTMLDSEVQPGSLVSPDFISALRLKETSLQAIANIKSLENGSGSRYTKKISPNKLAPLSLSEIQNMTNKTSNSAGSGDLNQNQYTNNLDSKKLNQNGLRLNPNKNPNDHLKLRPNMQGLNGGQTQNQKLVTGPLIVRRRNMSSSISSGLASGSNEIFTADSNTNRKPSLITRASQSVYNNNLNNSTVTNTNLKLSLTSNLAKNSNGFQSAQDPRQSLKSRIKFNNSSYAAGSSLRAITALRKDSTGNKSNLKKNMMMSQSESNRNHNKF